MMLHNKLEFWIDVNLTSRLSIWIEKEFKCPAKSFIELNLQTTSDIEIFKKTSVNPNIVIITTKDYDFVVIRNRKEGKPRILYLNIGNVSNKTLREIFDLYFLNAFKILTRTDQVLVEIKKEL